jgi:hypothetical protein
VLNERQAGAAIEGVVRQERVETSQLAVDTHGYTDFAMALARLLGFDLCPRLKELKQRHLFVPRGMKVPRGDRRRVRGQRRHGADRGPLGRPGAPGRIGVERARQRGDGAGQVRLGRPG